MAVDISKGFVDEKIDPSLDLVKEINQLKKEKDAIILAHYYTRPEVQDIADFVGDSLALAQQAAKTPARTILCAGVHFMAETAKILAPEKTVLIPDLGAGCSLAESCPPEEFKKFTQAHPDHKVITYVNTSAAIKALTDICCTSSNALRVVESFPPDQPLIFAPDRNLGAYIQKVTGRQNILLWQGACHVHEEFSLEAIIALKKQYPQAKLLAHPECKAPILLLADFIGSTAALLQYAQTDQTNQYIIATEPGILHQMQKQTPQKQFIPAPPTDQACACNNCQYMKLPTLEKIYLTLKHESPQITIPQPTLTQAQQAIKAMLDL